MSLLKNKVAIRKRVIVTLLLLVLFVIPIVAVKSNVNADTFGVFKYSVSNDGNIVIVGLSDTSVTTIDIPSEIDGKPVTMIENRAFQYCNNIKRVNIADSVKKIGDWAFVGCRNNRNLGYTRFCRRNWRECILRMHKYYRIKNWKFC